MGGVKLPSFHMKVKKVTIKLNSQVSGILTGEDTPAFLYRITGTDVAGVEHAYTLMVQTDGDTLNGSRGIKVYAGKYTVSQILVSRYNPKNARNILNASPDGINAILDVLGNDKGEVLFTYTLKTFRGYSHRDSVINQIG